MLEARDCADPRGAVEDSNGPRERGVTHEELDGSQAMGAHDHPALARALAAAQRELLWRLWPAIAHAVNNPLQGALGAVELAGLELAALELAAGLGAGPSAEGKIAPLLESGRGEIVRAAGLVGALQGLCRVPRARPSAPGRGDVAESSDPAASWERWSPLGEALAHHRGFELRAEAFADPAASELSCSDTALDVLCLSYVEAVTRGAKSGGPCELCWSAQRSGRLVCTRDGSDLDAEFAPETLALLRAVGGEIVDAQLQLPTSG